MRYADGPSTEVEVYVDAPVGRVWELASDIDLPGRFSAEYQGGEWLDGATEPAVGARFRGRNALPGLGEWYTVSTIVACEQNRVFAWVVDDPDKPGSQWRFELEPEGEGTRLRQWVRIGPGRNGVTWEIKQNPDQEEEIIERRLREHRANMQRVLLGMKELAEAEEATATA